MRYAKGTLDISSTRDVPLLLQVRNSKFIDHQQLWELMTLGNYEHSRESFAWRVKRLVDAGFLQRCEGAFGRGAVVYQIARSGLYRLESEGHYAVTLNSSTQRLPQTAQMHHALELNSIRIALAKAHLLASWQSDVETASINSVSDSAACKDFDAIVDVWNGNQLARFGLEYERSLKSAKRYREIREVLERDAKTNCILYVTSGFDIAWHLANELLGTSKRIAFVPITDFRQRLLDVEVITKPGEPLVRFNGLLHGVI